MEPEKEKEEGYLEDLMDEDEFDDGFVECPICGGDYQDCEHIAE